MLSSRSPLDPIHSSELLTKVGSSWHHNVEEPKSFGVEFWVWVSEYVSLNLHLKFTFRINAKLDPTASYWWLATTVYLELGGLLWSAKVKVQGRDFVSQSWLKADYSKSLSKWGTSWKQVFSWWVVNPHCLVFIFVTFVFKKETGKGNSKVEMNTILYNKWFNTWYIRQ